MKEYNQIEILSESKLEEMILICNENPHVICSVISPTCEDAKNVFYGARRLCSKLDIINYRFENYSMPRILFKNDSQIRFYSCNQEIISKTHFMLVENDRRTRKFMKKYEFIIKYEGNILFYDDIINENDALKTFLETFNIRGENDTKNM